MRARKALELHWPFLQEEADLSDDKRRHGEKLIDLMAKETFFRGLPEIEQHTSALESEYKRRHEEAAQRRAEAYGEAVERLRSTPGWERLNEDQQKFVGDPFTSRATTDVATKMAIPLLRSEVAACSTMLSGAVEQIPEAGGWRPDCTGQRFQLLQRGDRNEEQLDQALTGLKDQCLELIGEGKKVLVQ